MTSSAQKPDEGRNKRRKELEADYTEGPQLSSTDTADPVLSDGLQSLYKPESLEQLLNEMNKEIMNLLAKYAHILRQGHQPPDLVLDQAAQDPIQPGPEHLQGWSIHSLSGQLFLL